MSDYEESLNSLIEAVTNIVDKDGIDPKFVLESESKNSLADDAVSEIVANVSEFDNWYWDLEDERTLRLSITGDKDESDNPLFPIVKDIVESNLEGMREVDELPVEPDVDHITNQLVNYIINWQKWYYDYHMEQYQLDLGDLAGLNNEIYIESDYGDPLKSEGVSNMYDDDNVSFS